MSRYTLSKGLCRRSEIAPKKGVWNGRYQSQQISTTNGVHNKSTGLIEHSLNDKVWVRNKTSKAGESAKLALRRSGPLEIIKIMQKGCNFCLKNCRNCRLNMVESSEDNESSDDDSTDNGYMTPDAGQANQGNEPAPERRYRQREQTQYNIL